VLAAAAMALFVALGISERRQEFATMAAIGAPLSRIVRVSLLVSTPDSPTMPCERSHASSDWVAR